MGGIWSRGIRVWDGAADARFTHASLAMGYLQRLLY